MTTLSYIKYDGTIYQTNVPINGRKFLVSNVWVVESPFLLAVFNPKEFAIHAVQEDTYKSYSWFDYSELGLDVFGVDISTFIIRPPTPEDILFVIDKLSSQTQQIV